MAVQYNVFGLMGESEAELEQRIKDQNSKVEESGKFWWMNNTLWCDVTTFQCPNFLCYRLYVDYPLIWDFSYHDTGSTLQIWLSDCLWTVRNMKLYHSQYTIVSLYYSSLFMKIRHCNGLKLLHFLPHNDALATNQQSIIQTFLLWISTKPLQWISWIICL